MTLGNITLDFDDHEYTYYSGGSSGYYYYNPSSNHVYASISADGAWEWATGTSGSGVRGPGGETYLYGSDCGNVTVGGTTFEVGDTADIGADQASNPDYRHACDEHWVAKLDSVGEYEWHVVTEADRKLG